MHHIEYKYNTVTIGFLPRLHLPEGQTEVQLMCCHPVTIMVSLHYMQAIRKYSSIKKYGSTSYVGMGQVQNDVLYLRYMHLHTKTLYYSIVESAPRIPLTFLKVEKYSIYRLSVCKILINTRGKKFLYKIFTCRDEPIKRMETRPR